MSGNVTFPLILVELGFSVTMRLASITTVFWNGYTWGSGLLTANAINLQPSSSGSLTGSIFLENADNAMSTLILSEGARGKPVNIWYLYGTEPYQPEDAIQIFSGVIDGVPQMDMTVQLDIVSEGAMLWTPRITYTATRFSHMLPAGTVVTIGGQQFVLGNQ
jgi:hypothetical protein